MTRLLIVDDSALMRRQLTEVFLAEGDFEVAQARNGAEAVDVNRSFNPDVVTLDVNMPEMDGLTALSRIMVERPVPVVMVSSLTEQGALATFEALNLGAVDYVPKPGGTISLSIDRVRTELVAKVRAASRARLSHRHQRTLVRRSREESRRVEAPVRPTKAPTGQRLVLVGVSTGGPRTLEDILPELPADFPWPVLVAQHMPPTFTRTFAERLDQVCALRVCEVNQPMTIVPGTVYLGMGGADLVVSRRREGLVALPRPESPDHLWHPSVELLGRTALEAVGASSLVGVMLTGMGNDGSAAFTDIHRQGGKTIAESEQSAVVFGMPKELIDREGATTVLPAGRIVGQLQQWARR